MIVRLPVIALDSRDSRLGLIDPYLSKERRKNHANFELVKILFKYQYDRIPSESKKSNVYEKLYPACM